MPYIIHGATGAQGGPLYARLLTSGKDAIAAVRDPAKVAEQPAVAVDNDSVGSLIAAYRNADGIFVHLPNTSEPVRSQSVITALIKQARKLPKEMYQSLTWD